MDFLLVASFLACFQRLLFSLSASFSVVVLSRIICDWVASRE